MVRRGVAIFIALHGLIHLIGFAVPWKLAVFDGLPYSTSGVFGLVERVTPLWSRTQPRSLHPAH